MNIDSLSMGHKIAGGAGILAFFNMFLPWYGVGGELGEFVEAFGGDTSANAWSSAFSAWGGSIFLVAAAAVLLLKAFGTADVSRGSVKTEQIALGLAAVGALLILLRVLTQTEFAKVGLWFGLLLAGVTVFGAVTAMKEQGLGLPSADDLKTMTGESNPT